eukprot:6208295-Pleurochrysis_carterae.AAC.3
MELNSNRSWTLASKLEELMPTLESKYTITGGDVDDTIDLAYDEKNKNKQFRVKNRRYCLNAKAEGELRVDDQVRDGSGVGAGSSSARDSVVEACSQSGQDGAS